MLGSEDPPTHHQPWPPLTMGRLQMKEGEKKPRVKQNYSDPAQQVRSEKGQLFHAFHDGCTGKRWKIEASCLFRLEIIVHNILLFATFIHKSLLDGI